MAAGSKHRVANCRCYRRQARFTDTSGRIVSVHDEHFYLRGVNHTQHRVVVEIALLHHTVFERDFSRPGAQAECESDALSRGFCRNAAQPNSKFRVRVTRAKRGRGRKRRQPIGENWLDKTPAERHASMTWMDRLKRVFNIDIEICER